MELIKLHYIVLPMLSYNLCHTMNILTHSIKSYKNVFNLFGKRENDMIIFKNFLEEVDLKAKIKVIESLIYDTVKKYCNNDGSTNFFDIFSSNCELDSENNYYLVNVNNGYEYLKNIDEPLLIALLSTCEIIHIINDNLHKINAKIESYEKSYLKNIVLLKLQPELNEIIRYSKILDLRLNLLLNILKVYSPKK